MKTRYSVALAGALVAALSACGGGGSNGSVGGPLPVHSTSPTPTPMPTPTQSAPQSANLTFTINIPAVTVASASLSRSRTRPADFAAGTQSVTIAIGTQVLKTANVSATSSLCTAAKTGGRTCNVGVTAPSGSNTFTITAYDQPNGTGNKIAQGTVQAAPQTTPVAVAVAGTIAKLQIALSNPYPSVGTATQVNVVVNGVDVDGNVVLGPYASPISLANSDTSGATTLSTTTISSSPTSSTPVPTLNYNGATPYGSATITASLAGMASVSATFAPTPQFLKTFALQPAAGQNPFASGPGPQNISLGPDGNMWIAATQFAELIKVASDGTATSYPVPNASSQLQCVVTGSDGNLWFAENGNSAIGKMTTSGAVTEYTLPNASNFESPACVTLGKDGNIWFISTAFANNTVQQYVGSITTTGTVTEYPLPAKSGPVSLTSGPDGNIWITDSGQNAILKVSTSGAIVATYSLPTANVLPYGIAAGPDGNIWFTEFNGGKIGRVTTSGTLAEFKIPTGTAGPIAIKAGPDGRMWFSEMGAEAGIGKLGYVTVDGKQIRDFLGDGLHIHDFAFDSKGTLWYIAAQMPFGPQEFGTFAY